MASLAASKNITYSLALSSAKTFKKCCCHSTCFAATSNADFSGLSISDILCKGSWSSKPTWKLFHHKEIVTNKKVFEAKVSGRKKLIQERIEHRSTFKQRIKNSNSVQRKLYNTTMASKVKPH